MTAQFALHLDAPAEVAKRGKIFAIDIDLRHVPGLTCIDRYTRVFVAVCRYENNDPSNHFWNSHTYPRYSRVITDASLARLKRACIAADRNRKRHRRMGWVP